MDVSDYCMARLWIPGKIRAGFGYVYTEGLHQTAILHTHCD